MQAIANMSLLKVIRRHPTVCFISVTYAVSWSAWLPLAVTRATTDAGVRVGFKPLYLFGLIGPLIGAMASTAIIHGREGLRDLFARMARFRAPPGMWTMALGIPITVALAYYVLALPVSQPVPRWRELGELDGLPLTSPVAIWLLLILVHGLGQETGWRGFLLPTLQKRWSPLISSVIVAAFWALWHLPAFWVSHTYRQMPASAIGLFFLSLVSASVFLTWLYNQSRHSVLLVAVWHGTFTLLTSTSGARGALAAIESVIVIVMALMITSSERRARRWNRRRRAAA